MAALKPVGSPTRVAETRRRAALREIEENGTHGLLRNAKDAMVSAATAFNDVRLTLAGVKGDLDALCETEARLARELAPLVGGDVSFVVRSEGVTDADIEDEHRFAGILAELTAETDKFAVLARCVKLSEAYAKCVESWKSKRDKLAARTRDDGSSDAEYEAVQRKLEQVGHVLDQLDVRMDAVSRLFCSTATAIERKLAVWRLKFKVKFTKG